MDPAIQTILQRFTEVGDQKYGREAVTQLEHALQTATLAMEENAAPALIVAALLHDSGHVLEVGQLPTYNKRNLDDGHEQRGYAWVLKHFGPRVADPVRLHVSAKRYLCTTDPQYQQVLSRTSFKSYLDQGGSMSDAELLNFEAEPHFKAALRLRRWDDLAKDPERETPSIDAFVPQLEASLI